MFSIFLRFASIVRQSVKTTERYYHLGGSTRDSHDTKVPHFCCKSDKVCFVSGTDLCCLVECLSRLSDRICLSECFVGMYLVSFAPCVNVLSLWNEHTYVGGAHTVFSARPQSMSQSPVKKWCFTLHNYTQVEEDALKEDVAGNFDYIVFGYETTSRGTPHLQGFFILKTKRRRHYVANIVGLRRARVEAAGGTPAENAAYCKKDGNRFFERGEMRGQGYRSDIHTYVDAITTNEEPPLVAYMTHPKGVQATRQEHLRRTLPMERNPRIIVLYGAPGSGKSREAILGRDDNSVYIHYPTGSIGRADHWFCGYRGEKRCVLEEFNPKDYDINFFKKLTDVYKLELNTKGAHTYAAWDELYITTNIHPDRWYTTASAYDRRAVARRLHEVWEYSISDDGDYVRVLLGDGKEAMKLN